MLTRTCSYVSQCARARVTSTDKYGKSSQERGQFSSIPENNSAISIKHRGYFSWVREKEIIVAKTIVVSTNQEDSRMDEPRPFNPDPLVCIISRAVLQQPHGEKGSRKLWHKG